MKEMKREDVKEIFPNATEEEIDSILNKMGEEINPLKKQLKTAESERDTAKEALAGSQASEASLKSQLDEAKTKIEQGMTDEERIAAREKAAAEKEAEFLLKTNQLEAKSIFVEAGCFDAEEIEALVAQVSSDDGEATKANAQRIVDTVKKQREAVEKETKDTLLKGNPGLKDPGSSDTKMKKSEFMALPYKEQIAMREANPEIISQLQEG